FVTMPFWHRGPHDDALLPRRAHRAHADVMIGGVHLPRVVSGASVALLVCAGACAREASEAREPRALLRAPTRCERACAATDDEREQTVCHACRCKEALGELPPPDSMTC